MKYIGLKLFAVLMLLPAFMFAQELDGKTFLIQSAQEYSKGTKNGFWDVPGDNLRFQNGQNLQVWSLGSKQGDRKYRFKYAGSWGGHKYYYIQPRYTYSANVDVSGNNHKNGGNLQMWEKNNGEAQRFRVVNVGNGRWKIYSAHNYVLCLDNRSSRNGSNVHLWNDHNGPWMEWVFRDPYSLKAFGKSNSRTKKPRRNTNGDQPRKRKSLQ